MVAETNMNRRESICAVNLCGFHIELTSEMPFGAPRDQRYPIVANITTF